MKLEVQYEGRPTPRSKARGNYVIHCETKEEWQVVATMLALLAQDGNKSQFSKQELIDDYIYERDELVDSSASGRYRVVLRKY